VIGGWTDEDVYHLCYELRTRFPHTSLATCSHLTASPSASQHWNTLAQLKRVMAVTVTRTVKELIGWCSDGAMDGQSGAPGSGLGVVPYRLMGVPFRPRRLWPSFEWLGGAAAVPRNFHMDTDGEILAHLYRSASVLRISTLVGGYSNSMVLSIESEDASGVREAPSVVKLAPRADVATECQAFQRVEEMLGNNAPSVRGVVELGDRGGIKFRYTRMAASSTSFSFGAGELSSSLGSTALSSSVSITAVNAGGAGVRRLLDLAEDLGPQGEGVPKVNAMLDEVYGEIFGQALGMCIL